MKTFSYSSRFVTTLLAALVLCGCEKADKSVSKDIPEKLQQATAVQSSASASAVEFPKIDRVVPSDDTDPSGMAGLFLGQIIAVGRGIDIAVDQKLALLVTGALADATGGEISRESLRSVFKDAYIESIENGSSTLEGRTLPASIVTVQIKTVDRAAGRYGHICMSFAAQKDTEFNYLRSALYSFCDEKEHAQRVDGWKRETKFHQKSQFRA